MTPAEMREVLLDEARWWANQPAHSGTAHPWVTFFEQLPEDNRMLVTLWHVPGRERVPQQAPRSQSQPILIVEHDLPDHREAQEDASTAGQGLRYSRTLTPKRQAAWHSRIPNDRDHVGARREYHHGTLSLDRAWKVLRKVGRPPHERPPQTLGGIQYPRPLPAGLCSI
jgi:hypothetical protein